ncbi:class I SAM-dependent methyltransferase [Marinobacterium marinum]|uniref:Class I SAM-dependent methyltransferase n=1 Tax=Marinobacterium marinum TaxID=2756129 RepID=A0A7W1WX29_9GAMM|nr:class I SAM-dependent methyltransferase [Marinobacterium marinum]MBA4501758.1 class I SAM-dependent methyltransferase [Marinobacterium marinum]
MDLTSSHPLQRYWDLASARLQAHALEHAINMGLLHHFESPATPSAVAHRLQLAPDATAAFLELLWSMEILQRTPTSSSSSEAFTYQLTPVASRYLLDTGEHSCALAWRFRMQALETCGQNLSAFLEGRMTGNDAEYAPSEQAWAEAAKTQIAQEQSSVTAPAVAQLLKQKIDIPATGRFLDLGGGPGFISIALAHQYPGWTGTLFDWPATAEVAAGNIQAAGLNSRLSTCGGDATRDDLGGTYDLIWCSSVLHFLPDLDLALQRFWTALQPGGLLICAHAEIGTTPDNALKSLPFYLPLMLRGHYVPHQGELPNALKRNGFEYLSTHALTHSPMTPVQIHTGRKPE